MDNGSEMRDFLVSRRAKITPEQAGLPAYGGNRRVAGLRREEVALLAGVSIDYYVRLERGRAPVRPGPWPGQGPGRAGGAPASGPAAGARPGYPTQRAAHPRLDDHDPC